MKTLALLAVILATMLGSAFADSIVTLKSGDVLQGDIVSDTNGVLQIRAYFHNRTISTLRDVDHADIQSIQTQAVATAVSEPDRNRLRERLTKIIFPEVIWREVVPMDGVTWLASESRKLDPEGLGVNFVLTTDAGKPITLTLQNVPLIDIIKYVTSQSGLEYQIDSDAVVLYKAGAKPPSPQPPPGVMQDKLTRIVFPEVIAQETKIGDLLRSISEKSRRFDPKGEGVNCVLSSDSGQSVTLNVHNMPLGELIKFLSQLGGLTYRFESNAIVFDKLGEPSTATTRPDSTQSTLNQPQQQAQAEQQPGSLPDDLKAFLAAGSPSLPIGSPPNIGFMGVFRDRSFEINKDGSRYGFYVGKITSCPAGHRYTDGCGWWKEAVVLTGINLEGQPTDGRTTGIPENFVFRAVKVVKGVPCYGSKDCTLYVYKLVYDLNQYKDAISRLDTPQQQAQRQPKPQAQKSNVGLVANKTLIGRYASYESANQTKVANERRDSGINDAMAEQVAQGGDGTYIGGADLSITYKIEVERDNSGNPCFALYRYSSGTPYTPLRR